MLTDSDRPIATIVLAGYAIAGIWALVGLIARYLHQLEALARAFGHQ
jgi:hypothetical protein